MKVKEQSEMAGLKLNIQNLRSWHHCMPYRWENSGNRQILYSWAPKSLQTVTTAMKLKDACSFEENL